MGIKENNMALTDTQKDALRGLADCYFQDCETWAEAIFHTTEELEDIETEMSFDGELNPKAGHDEDLIGVDLEEAEVYLRERGE
jgi:hypothetical protein